MKVLLQRVSEASVSVDSEVIGRIDAGLLLLTGFGKGDSSACLEAMATKILNLRIFPDERGRFDRSALDTKGGILLVPQFTLFADTSKGRRPEFFNALEPAAAEMLFKEFSALFERACPGRTAQGRFGAYMQVSLLNDGPVTIMLDS